MWKTLTGAHAGKVLHILDILESGLHLFLQKFVLLLLGNHVVCICHIESTVTRLTGRTGAKEKNQN